MVRMFVCMYVRLFTHTTKMIWGNTHRGTIILILNPPDDLNVQDLNYEIVIEVREERERERERERGECVYVLCKLNVFIFHFCENYTMKGGSHSRRTLHK